MPDRARLDATLETLVGVDNTADVQNGKVPATLHVHFPASLANHGCPVSFLRCFE